jgi:hypothetical protein
MTLQYWSERKRPCQIGEADPICHGLYCLVFISVAGDEFGRNVKASIHAPLSGTAK